MEAPHFFGGIIQSGFHFLHMGAYEGLQSLFSYSSDAGIYPSPPPGPSVTQASPFMLYGQYEVAPPVIEQTTVSEDVHACMDCLEQQIRMLDSSIVWDDSDGILVVSLLAKFRMPEIERYTCVGCLCIHLRLYSVVMRGHGLDESQMITLFPLSLSGTV
ncbi:hypothetical protein AAG906_016445 [Vitis piasezkii]